MIVPGTKVSLISTFTTSSSRKVSVFKVVLLVTIMTLLDCYHSSSNARDNRYWFAAGAWSMSILPPSSSSSTRLTSISSSSNTNTRRNFLLSTAASSAAAAAVVVPSSVSATTATELTPLIDNIHRFSISIPSNWIKSDQTLPDRRKIVFYTDPSDTQTVLFIAYTPVRDDFTSLSSFGTVDQVAQATILPKGTIAGGTTESAMLNAESKKQAYFFDYRQKAEGLPETHFRTIFTLIQGATGGAGAVLVTITVQTSESRYKEQLQPLLDEIINSYQVGSSSS